MTWIILLTMPVLALELGARPKIVTIRDQKLTAVTKE